jgi:hypothetical protein
MMRRTITTTLGKAIVAGALGIGFLAVTSQAVSATTPPNYYVTPGGGSTPFFNCHNFFAANACSLSRALTLANAVPGTIPLVIHLQAGTYHDTPLNAACPGTSAAVDITRPNITIKGPVAWPPTATIEPCSTQAEPGIEDTTQQNVLVDVAPGITGATLKHLTINGADAQTSFSPCTQDYVGVYFGNSSGTLNHDLITNVEQPPGGGFGCQPGADGDVYAVTCNASDPNELGNPCTGDPNQAQSSVVTITDGAFNQYDKNGITCDGALTTCTIEGAKVTGFGATPLLAENGIQIAYDADASITNSTVKDNSDTAGGVAASGILAYWDGEVTISGGTVEDNDVNIAPVFDSLFSIKGAHIRNATDASVGSGQGIMPYDTVNAIVGTNTTPNVIENNPGGGVFNYGSFATEINNNTIASNAAGGVIDVGSSNTAILNNTITSNAAGGVIGADPTGEVVGTTGSGNTISSNSAGNVIELAPSYYSGACTITANTFAGTGGYIWENVNPLCSTPTGNSPSAANTPALYTGPSRSFSINPLSPSI